MRIWACILMLVAGMASAEPVVLERFDAGAEARWRYIADGVMGGVSQGGAQITTEGLHLTGTVSTDNNGGFIQVRRALPDGLPLDASVLVLSVRGNGQRYTVFIRTGKGRRPWHNYKASFVAGEAWSEVRLEFTEFERSHGSLAERFAAQDVVSIGLAAYGADYEADLWVSGVRVE